MKKTFFIAMPSKTNVSDSDFKVAKLYDHRGFSSKKWLRDLKREEKTHTLISQFNQKSSSKLAGVVTCDYKKMVKEPSTINCMIEAETQDSSLNTATHIYKDGYTMLIFDLIKYKPTSRSLI